LAGLDKFNNYLNQAGLDYQQEIEPFFEKQFAFALMPANQETPFPFLLIFKQKNQSAEFSQRLSQIEAELKKDYNFSTQIYRQVEITLLKPFSALPAGAPRSYAYAQIEDNFIISNSQGVLEKTIDLVINQ